jgi:YD repeat-containing protein
VCHLGVWLKVGNTNEVSAGRFWRTAWHVPYEKLAGKHVTAASVAVTVTAGTVNAYGSGTGGPVVLSTASSLAYAGKGTQLATAAVGSSGTFSSASLTSTLNSWTTGKSSGHYFMFSGWEAAGTYTYKQLSASVSITYNSYPGQPTGRSVKPCSAQCTGASVLTNSATPQLTGNTSDADGNKLRYDFEVWAGWSASPTTRVSYGSVSNVASGATATWTVPTTLADGGSYEYRVRAFDGTDYGAWSNGWVLFTVDTTAPAIPTVSSDTWSAGDWDAATSGTISWADTATDIASYSWQLDGGSWSAPTTATSQALSGLASNKLHTFNVRATDRAGNVSGVGVFTFGVGTGGLTSPADQDRTQSTVTLSAVAPPGYSYATYQWRQGDTAGWAAVPLGDVTVTGDPSRNPTAWPAAVGDSFVWNVRHTASTDGVVQVRVCLSQNADGSSPVCPAAPVHVQLAAHAFGASYATSDVGPGSVSLLTGDFEVSATDVNVAAYNGSLSLGRTSTTLAPPVANTGATGVFGPGWTASLTGPDAGVASYTATVAPDKSYVTLVDSDGGALIYEVTSALTADPITYSGDGDAADGSTVSLNAAGTVLTHVDVDGTKTTWSKVAGVWVPASVVQTGAAAQNTTSYLYNTTGASAGLPARIIAPAPAGVDCSTELKADTTAGCRSLTFDYTTLTANGTSVQRLAAVNLVAYDPKSGTMRAVKVAAYDYDGTGRLTAAYDPRITPNLKTAYTYDAAGRLSTVTPPGLSPWTLHFDSDGRLSTVTRPDPSGPTATWTIIYGLPIQGSGAPVDLSAAATGTWGQTTDLPVVGAAVFSPDHVPAGTDLGSVAVADWPYADLTYPDVNGREVDTASYGAGAWQITSARYNTGGNEVWSLTAGNRAQALAPTADTDPAVTAALPNSADRANLLATQSTYNTDGTELIDVLGPTHPVTLADGSVIDARTHTVTAYDEGAPADGGPYRLATTTTTSAQDLDGADHDRQVTHQGYDPILSGDTSGWTLRAVTTSTNAAGLVTTTRYNTAGQVIETRLPGGAAGGTSQSTVTSYFTATGSGGCVNPAFAGLACTFAPAAQPASGKPLATTTYTHDLYDNVVSKTETFGGGAGATTRTTTLTYDGAERVTGSSITVNTETAGGTPLPAVTYGYDPTTGLPTTISTTTGGVTTTLRTGYDQLGRATSYTDATGNVSRTSYDLDGRPVTVNDGKGTTNYIYDSATEHRGLVTGLDIGVAGAPSTFTGSYDAAGNLDTETYPNGWTATTSYDNTGDAVGLDYAAGDQIVLSFTRASNAQGQTVTQSSPHSGS